MKHALCLAFLAVALIAFGTEINAQQSICTRGIAVPVLKPAVFPNSKFKLTRDKRTSIESVATPGGDRLSIRNWGCEYYVLTFRFETSRYRHRVSDSRYWFRKAVLEMTDILPGIEAPIDIKKGIAKLKAYTETSRKGKMHRLKYGEEITFGGDERDPNGDDILQTVNINKVRKLKGDRYSFEITFAAGPL